MKKILEKKKIIENKKIIIIVSLIVILISIGCVYALVIKPNQIESDDKNAILYPSLTYNYNGIQTEYPKNEMIKFTSKFTYFGLVKYYYQAKIYAGNTLVKTGECRSVSNNLEPYYEFNAVVDDEYVITSVYKTKDCSGKSTKDYKSKSFNVSKNSGNTGSETTGSKKFTATFDKQFATKIGSSSESCTTNGSSCSVKAPTITRSGTEILGWDTNSKSTTPKYKPGDSIKLSSDQKYYAITKVTYTAKFYKSGADKIGSDSLPCSTIGDSCTVKAPSITRSGYTVNGWSESNILFSVAYKVGDTITLKSNKSFYAYTSAKQKTTYKATFNKNGATSIGSTYKTCDADDSGKCTIQAPSITRSGYSILGWSTNSKATTATYKVGSSITLKDNMTLYAITSNKSISMTKFTENFKSGHGGQIKITVNPSSDTFTIKSSDPSVIKLKKVSTYVYDMVAEKNGKSTVTVTSSSGATDSITYTVTEYKASKEEPRGLKRLKNGGTEKTIDGIKVYIENKCNMTNVNSHISYMKKMPKLFKEVTNEVYFLTEATTKSHNKEFHLGISHLGPNFIDAACTGKDAYYTGVMPHEMAHLADYRYKQLTGNYYSEGEAFTLKYNANVEKQNTLREYSYYSKQEFFADAVSYYERGQKNIKKDISDEVKIAIHIFKNMKGWSIK